MIRAHGHGKQVQRRRATHLEELHTDASKHELQKRSDDQDVADSSDRHEHTLHDVLWAHKRKQFYSGNADVFQNERRRERQTNRKIDRKADRRIERKKERKKEGERQTDTKRKKERKNRLLRAVHVQRDGLRAVLSSVCLCIHNISFSE